MKVIECFLCSHYLHMDLNAVGFRAIAEAGVRKDYRERVHLCCGLGLLLLILIWSPPNYMGVHTSACKPLQGPAPSWF